MGLTNQEVEKAISEGKINIIPDKKFTDEEKKKKESLLGAYIGIMVSDNNSTMKALRNRFIRSVT